MTNPQKWKNNKTTNLIVFKGHAELIRSVEVGVLKRIVIATMKKERIFQKKLTAYALLSQTLLFAVSLLSQLAYMSV